MIVDIKSDTTRILPCRKGDIFAWVHFTGDILSGNIKYDIADIWVMNEGDYVQITNRLEDVPDWLPIFPTKVTGRNTWIMQKRLNDGFDPYVNQVDLSGLPNVWKTEASHYVVWIGESRSDVNAENGVLSIFHITCGSLTVHNPKNQSDFILSNNVILNLTKQYLNDNARKTMTWAQELISKRGMPRSFSPVWKLG